MKIQFRNYNSGYRIVSTAFDAVTRDDLLADRLDFLYIENDRITLLPDSSTLSTDSKMISKIKMCSNYDVFELWPDGTLYRCFDINSTDNYFYITGRCNSNCIMCPSPEISKHTDERTSIDNLIEIAKHIPIDTPHLTITGGEPFIIGKEIFSFIDFLRYKFKTTEFLILTNGRVFCLSEYAELLSKTLPDNSIIAIPLHGSSPSIHDRITRTNNSFIQSLSGIKNLIKLKIRIELRIVVNKLNINDFADLVDLIISEIHGVEYISIIAMEMTGNAFQNREQLWIPYREAFYLIAPAIQKLIHNCINVRIYNFPICTVSRQYWTICEKSISSNKVMFSDVCHRCKMKNSCGGVFAGTYLMEKNELEAIE